MKLSTRLAIAMVALVVVTAAAVGTLIYRNIVANGLPRALDRMDTYAQLAAVELQASVDRVRADVLGFGAAVAVQDIIIAHERKSRDPSALAAEAETRRRLALRFVAELKAKPDYAQFRLIGVENGGREIVRVDRSSPDGSIRIVPDAELQTKEDRDYFKSTISLPADEVFISTVDLNREHGAFELPYVPTLRAAVPLLASDGKPFGIIVINYDLRRTFDRVRSIEHSHTDLFIVNENGDYLVHPDFMREFGFEFGTPFRIQDDFPELSDLLRADSLTPRVAQNRDGHYFGLGLKAVRLAGGPRITVVESIPYSELMASARTARNYSLIGGGIAVIGAVLVAIFLARSLSRPMAQIAKAAEGFARGEVVDVPSTSSGEIGTLARAFTQMATTIHEKTEALRIENEERRRIFDTSLDLILVTDTTGNFARVSPSCKRILGYAPEEMIGHNATEFIHPDDLESTRQEMRAARRGGHETFFETRYIRKDGHAVTLAWSGVWSEPERRHFFIGRDMTERRRYEAAEREIKNTLEAVIDASPVAIVCLDTNRNVIVWSRAAEQIFGYLAAETLGQPYKLVPPGLESQFDDLFDRALKGETFRDEQVQRRRKDGTLVDISFSGAAMYDERGAVRGVAYALTDMTDRLKLEQQLRQSQKMDAIGQLTGGVAHDFNNILTVITGTIEILADAVAHDPQLAEIASLIDEAATRGAQLTGQLLAFARRQPLQPRETDVNGLIVETQKLLRPALGEQIEIQTAFEADAWPALIDPNQLNTALLNLVVNARDAMPDGGKLTIETGNVVLDESYAKMNSEVIPGEYVMVSVSDSGSGIPKKIREKIFEPFFSTKAVGKGTGLGLSMVYGFVKQSGGHIKVYSEEGHGTTFRLYLPRAGVDKAAQPDAATTLTVEGGSETILVVEDDNLVRTYVIAQLQSLGYKTLSVASGPEAIAVLEAGASFDLLFTDVIMQGGMNGPQLAAEVAKRHPGLKVVFTSGYTENAIVHHGRLDPGVLLLAKPYRKADLANIIRQALNADSTDKSSEIRAAG